MDKLTEIPQMSFLQLEEALRECWTVMQDYYNYVEKTRDFDRLNIQVSLMKNAIWSRAIVHNFKDNRDILEWWQLHADTNLEDSEEEYSDDDENLDSITRIRMENPVRLPSGSMVDRSTYTMLLQTSGKDPFTMVDLPSLD